MQPWVPQRDLNQVLKLYIYNLPCSHLHGELRYNSYCLQWNSVAAEREGLRLSIHTVHTRKRRVGGRSGREGRSIGVGFRSWYSGTACYNKTWFAAREERVREASETKAMYIHIEMSGVANAGLTKAFLVRNALIQKVSWGGVTKICSWSGIKGRRSCRASALGHRLCNFINNSTHVNISSSINIPLSSFPSISPLLSLDKSEGRGVNLQYVLLLSLPYFYSAIYQV